MGTQSLHHHLTTASRIVARGMRFGLTGEASIRFALEILAMADGAQETGDRELVRRASLPATRIDGAAGSSPEQGPDASAAAADVSVLPRNPGKSVRDGEGGDALPEPDISAQGPAEPDAPPRTMTERVIDAMNAGLTNGREIAELIGHNRPVVETTMRKVKARRDPRLKEFAPAPEVQPEPEPGRARVDFKIGEREFSAFGDARWGRLLELMSHGGLMFVDDLAKRLDAKPETVRELLAFEPIRPFAADGLALEWQGRDFVRLVSTKPKD